MRLTSYANVNEGKGLPHIAIMPFDLVRALYSYKLVGRPDQDLRVSM